MSGTLLRAQQRHDAAARRATDRLPAVPVACLFRLRSSSRTAAPPIVLPGARAMKGSFVTLNVMKDPFIAPSPG
jgi:hypothetical protein